MNADQNQTSQVTLENIEALAQLGHEDNWSSGGSTDDGNCKQVGGVISTENPPGCEWEHIYHYDCIPGNSECQYGTGNYIKGYDSDCKFYVHDNTISSGC